MNEFNEIRLDDKGKLDDIAIGDIHLERMDDHWWWLGVYREVKDKRCKNGKRLIKTTFLFTSKSKINVEVEENGFKSKMVEKK